MRLQINRGEASEADNHLDCKCPVEDSHCSHARLQIKRGKASKADKLLHCKCPDEDSQGSHARLQINRGETSEAGKHPHPNVTIKNLHVRLQINRGEASEEELAARREKAMADPQIQQILTDPVVRQVRAHSTRRLRPALLGSAMCAPAVLYSRCPRIRSSDHLRCGAQRAPTPMLNSDC